mgnify:CR=1 FL=1
MKIAFLIRPDNNTQYSITMNAAATVKLPPPSFRRKQLPPTEFLKECFDYFPESGELRWKKRPLHHFGGRTIEFNRWNTRYAGKLVGNKQFTAQGRNARLQFDLRINKKRNLLANHHVIFAIMGVEVPSHLEVDHINGDGWDNRWSNLRLSTRQENCRNRCGRSKKEPLPKGVFRQGGRFYANIGIDVKKYINSPPFTTPEKAREWYQEMAQKYHGEFFCAR